MSVYDLEWVNSNASKNYPLSDDASMMLSSGNVLPMAVLTDFSLSMPPIADVNFASKIYLSQIAVGVDHLLLVFSYDVGGTAYQLCRVQNIPLTLQMGSALQNKTFTLQMATTTAPGYQNLKRAYGKLVIGALAGVAVTSGTLTYAAGKLNPICIHIGVACVTALNVGTVYLSGNVVLKQGDGIQLSVDQSGTNPVVTINRVNMQSTYSSVAQAVTDIKTAFGNPIMTINGIAPSVTVDSTTGQASADFTIYPADCISITAGTNSLTFSNPCSKPCCDNTYDDQMNNIVAQLQSQQSILLSYFTSLSTNLNTMGSRLSTLLAASK